MSARLVDSVVWVAANDLELPHDSLAWRHPETAGLSVVSGMGCAEQFGPEAANGLIPSVRGKLWVMVSAGPALVKSRAISSRAKAEGCRSAGPTVSREEPSPPAADRTATGAESVNPAESQTVLAAAELGWCMAELYAEVRPDELQPPEAPEGPLPRISSGREPRRVPLQEDLPGLGSLQARQDLQLLIDRVHVGFRKLVPVIIGAGLTVGEPEDWAAVAYHRRSAEGRYQLARSVLQFHGDLFVALTACDHQVGLAYGLGRAVADLSLRPRADEQDPLTSDLRGGRVDTIVGWLRELHTVLPPHSAGAVMGSITQWQQWAAHPTWKGVSLDWNAHGKDVVKALADQGKRWRLLLTGQVAALDQLSPNDYVQAAGYLIGRVRKILQQVLKQYWPWVTASILVMVAGVVASLLLLNSPAAKGIGVAISVFGWLGVTGRSVSGELQRTVSHVEQSLWCAELDLAAAWANTLLPDADANRQLDEAQVPRSRLGQAAVRLVTRRPQPPGHP